jgi:hypothetical protein
VEDRHDRVHAENVVRRGGEARHELGVEVGLRERSVDQVHPLDRDDRAEGAGRYLVDVTSIDRREEAPPWCHPLTG